MSAPAKSRWRGVPADERQAERRTLLVEAAFELLGTAGIASTTVRGVCEAARLNPRYFYESFEDLDALLVAVFERTAVDSLAVMMAAAEAVGGEPVDQMRAALGAFVRHVTDDPRRTQVLFVEGMSNEALTRRRLRSMNELADLLVAGARESVGLDIDDPILTISANVMVGGMSELLISWLRGKLDVTLDQLVDDASQLFVVTGEAAGQIALARHRARTRTAPKRVS